MSLWICQQCHSPQGFSKDMACFACGGPLEMTLEHCHAPWLGPPAGEQIMADVQKMVEALRRDTQYGPSIMYLPDRVIIALGGDPNDHPELEGYPGVRVVEMK